VDDADKLLWTNTEKMAAPLSGQSRAYGLYFHDDLGNLTHSDRRLKDGTGQAMLDYGVGRRRAAA
jgi:hypothetical protein